MYSERVSVFIWVSPITLVWALSTRRPGRRPSHFISARSPTGRLSHRAARVRGGGQNPAITSDEAREQCGAGPRAQQHQANDRDGPHDDTNRPRRVICLLRTLRHLDVPWAAGVR